MCPTFVSSARSFVSYFSLPLSESWKTFLYFYVWVPEDKRKALFNKVKKLILYMLGIIAIASPSCVFASLLWFPYLNKQLFCLYHLNMQTENTDCNNSTRGTRSESAGSDKKAATCLSRSRNVPQLYQRKTYPVTLSSYKTSHIF